MEGAEVLVDLVDRAEALDGGRSGFDERGARVGWLAGDLCVSRGHCCLFGGFWFCKAMRKANLKQEKVVANLHAELRVVGEEEGIRVFCFSSNVAIDEAFTEEPFLS